ncbi:hypothetical protein OS493_030178 [Desmophyllum pertusum]|uniref:EGF-like domain-containing protein n=1 Tax=Desmophyllum pertusum TaxID=174260 RepID=A0A9W9Z049_9CNID|nr:hypothetical protein OS493_030178 [Desmophyllum pertusum]
MSHNSSANNNRTHHNRENYNRINNGSYNRNDNKNDNRNDDRDCNYRGNYRDDHRDCDYPRDYRNDHRDCDYPGTTEMTTPFTGSTTPNTGTTATPTPTTSGTTPPPTTPPPCECPNGEKGIVDPDGNCDCPPDCPKGKKAVIVNNRYQCPDHPPCGEPPNCVVGRKGPECSQPDVQPCSGDCSGNGVAVSVADCGSRCVCSARWTGTCCETRQPVRNWGDPHLETLDGIEYDYYGIGEFWGCKSVFNDFGIQFRYFAYQRASLTGGVAIKAG